MSSWRKWLRPPIGKLLVKLHKWNAYLVILLTLSGIVLSIGAIRGDLGESRVWLKQIHIWAGVVSTVLLIVYLPNIAKHLKQIRNKPQQKLNLAIVLFLLLGWIVSGLILWQFRQFTPEWSNAALVVHDIFTWVGIPYALFHSITRSRWLKVPNKRSVRVEESGKIEILRPAVTSKPFYTRREFIKWTVGIGTVALIGPFFLRWLNTNLSTGSLSSGSVPASDGNHMLPVPEPLPDSVALIGGGAKGNFRIYTVTEIPAFSSDNWTFSVKGLVDNPMDLNWEQFLKLKRTVQVSDFHCVTGWSVYKNTWEGIPLSALLDQAGVQSNGKFVKFYSGDGVYTDCLSLEQSRADDIMVAVLHEGKPIPQELGGPVRLIVPKMYTYKSVKWLQSIEVINKAHMGYWEVRGYDNDAWIKA
jgi:sulfoxide reductase catalytic subunit YedY